MEAWPPTSHAKPKKALNHDASSASLTVAPA